jgi:hypothetical protein
MIMDYQKIDVYPDKCMLFWKDHENDSKCLKCGKSRYVEVGNDDGEMVTSMIAHKQLLYIASCALCYALVSFEKHS